MMIGHDDLATEGMAEMKNFGPVIFNGMTQNSRALWDGMRTL